MHMSEELISICIDYTCSHYVIWIVIVNQDQLETTTVINNLSHNMKVGWNGDKLAVQQKTQLEKAVLVF